MSTARSRSLVLLLTAMFIAALSVIGTPSASAAPACYNGTCRNIDPNTATNYEGVKCTQGAYTKTEFSTGSHRVEMRYSPTCMAVWTRITTLSAAAPTACNVSFGQIVTYTPQRVYAYSTGIQAGCAAGSSAYSNMSPFDGVLVRSCVGVWYNAQPVSGTPCSNYF